MSDEITPHRRRSIRMPGYDYREEGGYFVTICAAQRRCVFGTVEGGEVRLHSYGQIVAEEWERTASIRPEVMLSNYVVMPNHFHGIVLLTPRRGMACHARDVTPNSNDDGGETPLGMARHAPTFGQPQAQALSTIIGAFKSAVTRRINEHRAQRGLAPVTVWQRNYYERIIRDEKELHETQRYIIENPLYWPQDELYTPSGFSK